MNGPGRCTAAGTAINGYIRCKRTNQIQTSCRQPCTIPIPPSSPTTFLTLYQHFFYHITCLHCTSIWLLSSTLLDTTKLVYYPHGSASRFKTYHVGHFVLSLLFLLIHYSSKTPVIRGARACTVCRAAKVICFRSRLPSSYFPLF